MPLFAIRNKQTGLFWLDNGEGDGEDNNPDAYGPLERAKLAEKVSMEAVTSHYGSIWEHEEVVEVFVDRDGIRHEYDLDENDI